MEYTKMGFKVRAIKLSVVLLISILAACAQVPKEAVEMSATVGRDLTEMKKSHVALVDLYYSDLIDDINSFVDDVYLPYQIQSTLSDELWKKEMLSAIESASKRDPSGKAQKESLEKIKIFLLLIQEEVESYRKLKLEPVQAEYSSVLKRISESYDQIHYANSIVTGHLASVVKVHDSQNEILEKADLKDLRTNVGKETAVLSKKIDKLLLEAKKGDKDLKKALSEFEKLLKKKN